ncbi:hydroxyisourate hydrolase [Novosphingobium mangrovi (ex Huang et al. 2023)]|uniref:5-hydroxyisourate hydrolase n=1 Tax=Novosphingobium mangrovi (ex Huang et al. 2023) TaxID=2976432 RepID=A0ABT2I2E1_9SPHN|nr:hydroxyisourate hydrolase [Novosphingobium mangrovi (ex Huang et al. 2023)]MCT2398976.1 hydroxyisourate hydrolase [Novosphingobium mangrovi (ex Huang et al. 2023)]
MSTLSTHVLDTAHGCPAAGVALTLSTMSGTVLFEGETDSDGRCPGIPEIPTGCYRLTFAVAVYFRGRGVKLPEPPFLDRVSIDFGIADPDGHYHVPLLASPFGYSTYRGS